MEKKTLTILLIEDDKIEVMKFQRALEKLDLPHEVAVANDGEEALTMLQNGKVSPCILFLDLNMPKISGLDFLKTLKNDPKLRYLPTIILTTSNNRKDVLASYEIGVAGYILKPLKYQEYLNKIEKTLAYWCENVLIKL